MELDVVVQLYIMLCYLLLMTVLLDVSFPFRWDGVEGLINRVNEKG